MKMAEDSLAPASVTEADVVETLRHGGEGGTRAACRRMDRLEKQLDMNEMIEASAMRSLRYDRTRVQESGDGCDTVFNIWQDVKRIRREQDRYIIREMEMAREEAGREHLIWISFYQLREDLRRVLEMYYIEKKSVDDIAGELFISKATVWRRRKNGVDALLDICRTESCARDRLLSG